jgi:hypothetical protein
MPDYFYVYLTSIMIVGSSVAIGAWLNERKLTSWVFTPSPVA